MIVSCSSVGIVDPNRPGQGVQDMLNVGFNNMLVDMSMCCNSHELEQYGKANKNRNMFSKVSDINAKFQLILDKSLEKGICMDVMRAPGLALNTKRTDINGLLSDIHKECIRLCSLTKSKYIIIPPIFAGVELSKEWDVNKEYYLGLAAYAKEYSVNILLKNQCKDVNGRMTRGICSDPYEAAEWIDRLNKEVGEERFGFCMDIGICNLCGQDMREFAVTLGTRIKAVILRDSDGQNDVLLLPFTSANHGQHQTDWLSLIRGLREIEFDGYLILDMLDTAAVFSTMLKPQLIKFAKSIADYFKWQIEIESFLKKYDKRVLFGAGNMCRNYMKCYGDKYPPLYTCDNNKALWGTVFEGLEVKNPEELKKLPEDCAIFICNIYYREIESQLRDMGVKNPIEFFNDEYMASFYVDRLER